MLLPRAGSSAELSATEDDRSSAQTVANQVLRSKEQCLRELFTFLKLRKKQYSAFLPRFAQRSRLDRPEIRSGHLLPCGLL